MRATTPNVARNKLTVDDMRVIFCKLFQAFKFDVSSGGGARAGVLAMSASSAPDISDCVENGSQETAGNSDEEMAYVLSLTGTGTPVTGLKGQCLGLPC